ncbi:MAG: alcohol dehydrogenase catalytic domain-containing protein [Dermatophilaceae bacterium]
MLALTWQGPTKVEVRDVPKPVLQEPTDVVVRVTSSAICGSDLHLFGVMGPYLTPGDILGHEFMGVIEQVGAQVGHLHEGDRVVVPFTISCGSCGLCSLGLQSQCETTQVREFQRGAALFGYTKMYGAVPGGQAQYVRVPQAHYGPIPVPDGAADERYLYLSDILPTAWQGVRYAGVHEGSTLAVVGLGPVGQLAARCARLLGASRVIGLDLVPERLSLASAHGVEAVDVSAVDDAAAAVLDATGGYGVDAVVEAVGMEASRGLVDTVAGAAASLTGRLPSSLGQAAMEKVGIDRMAALHASFQMVCRGGTVSMLGVYGGAADPLPLGNMFDKGVTVRMGQANVRRWTDELLEIVGRDDDVLGLESLATHHVPLTDAPAAYEMFRAKQDGCIKVVLDPTR